MPASRVDIIGRDAMLAALAQFVDEVASGLALRVLEGAPGCGKSTVWEAAIASAKERDMRCLVARPAAAESALAFAGLRDLIEPVFDADVADALPVPLREVLEVVLLRRSPDAPVEPGAAGLACQRALAHLTADRPLVLAVDDVQWLDRASATAIGFVLRRMANARLGALFAHRVGTVDPLDLLDLVRRTGGSVLAIEPLRLEALQRILRSRCPGLGATAIRRLARRSAGNPLHALELGRVALGVGSGEGWRGSSLQALLAARLGAMSASTAPVLTAIALCPDATDDGVAAALNDVDVEAALGEAVAAELVVRGGRRLRFTHPLLASATIEASGPSACSALHRRLAAVAESPEERATHLARAADTASEAVAAAVEEGARAALRRGAPDVALELAEQAYALTPLDDPGARQRRALLAGSYAFAAGDSQVAGGHLDTAAKGVDASVSAEASARLGRVHMFDGQLSAAISRYEAALVTPGVADTVAVEAHEGLAWSHLLAWRNIPAAAAAGAAAVVLAAQLGNGPLTAECRGVAGLAATVTGDVDPLSGLRTAARLTPSRTFGRVMRSPEFALAVSLAWRHETVEALAIFSGLLGRCGERGDEVSRPRVLFGMAAAALHGGRVDEARQFAVEGRVAADLADQLPYLGVLLMSDEVACGASGTLVRAELLPIEGETANLVRQRALGLQALAADDATAAAQHLGALVARLEAAGGREPGVLREASDAAEALIALGRLEDAKALIDRFEAASARRDDLPPVLSLRSRRARVLEAAAAGDRGALARAETLMHHQDSSIPAFERARTLLATGSIARRAKQKRSAREYLNEAASCFARLGATAWHYRAQTELARVGGRTATGALTPSERRVAELVGEGLTNRQIAARLFVTEKTIEAHLSRVYMKFGVSNRVALGRHLSSEALDASR